MDPRENLQRQAREKWLASERKNSIILPTGSGKSKVTIDLIKELNPTRILLVTNSEELRDNSWKAEFIKFDALDYWKKTESECYQTMHNRTGEWDLIVFDEIDFACTEVYGKCLSQNNLKANNVIGLTGFITEDKEQFLEYFYPICFKANIEELQEQNILNKSELILIEYPISIQKTLKQKTKKGQDFYVSENDQYKYWDKRFTLSAIVKSQLEKKYKMLNIDPMTKKDYVDADWGLKIAAAKRKKILHTLDTTTKVTKNLIDYIHSTEGNKVLIFTTLTTECDKLPNPYHGKSDEDFNGIEKLNSGEITTMSVVKKITRGLNLVGVNYLIRSTYDGSETDFNQSHGRGMRLRVGQLFKYIILLPMYQDLVKMHDGSMKISMLSTQAERWMTKMIQSFENPTIRRVRLDKTLTIKPEMNI